MADSEQKASPRYRVTGTDTPPFDTLQTRIVLSIEQLKAADNVEALFVQAALQAAAELSALWDTTKDNIELVSEEVK